jgi:hypothetical protein
MAAPTLPGNWDEVTLANQRYLPASLALLQASFPKRYRHLNAGRVTKKMGDRTTSKSDLVSGLKVFRRIVPPDTPTNSSPAAVDMAAFFFVRLVTNAGPEAYCLSLGVDSTAAGIDADAVHRDLAGVCRVMRNYISTLPNAANTQYISLDIINEIDLDQPAGGPPADLDDTPHAKIIGKAYTIARLAKQLVAQSALPDKSCPWPSELFRWIIQNP